jgi:hypothetical protein
MEPEDFEAAAPAAPDEAVPEPRNWYRPECLATSARSVACTSPPPLQYASGDSSLSVPRTVM